MSKRQINNQVLLSANSKLPSERWDSMRAWWETKRFPSPFREGNTETGETRTWIFIYRLATKEAEEKTPRGAYYLLGTNNLESSVSSSSSGHQGAALRRGPARPPPPPSTCHILPTHSKTELVSTAGVTATWRRTQCTTLAGKWASRKDFCIPLRCTTTRSLFSFFRQT